MRNTWKTITTILSIILILCSFNVEVSAQNGWDGVTEIQPVGEGTATDPFLISTAEELAWYRTQINEYDNTSCAKLIADIDLNNKNWIPIGRDKASDGYAFAGDFDGNGHTVRGLNVNISNDTSSACAYGFFGKIYGVSETITATVADLILEGSVTYNRVVKQPSTVSIGGLCGVAARANITRCAINVTVTAIKESDDESFTNNIYFYVGCICGSASHVNFTDCVSTGNIYTTNGYAAGIVGKADTGTLLRCCNTGTVTGYSRVGGIVGYNGTTSKDSCIEYLFCYNAGSVNAVVDNAGGLIGYIELSDSSNAIITINGCFSTGLVSAPQNAGGCIGRLYYWGGTISTDNVNYLDTSAENEIGKKSSFFPIVITSKTSAEMSSMDYVVDLNVSAISLGFPDDVFKAGLNHPIFVWQPDEISAVTLGDINNDGTVNASDVSDLIYALATGATLDFSVADINSDGTVNASDASELILMIQPKE